jgi:hypothetical protein
VCGGEGLPDPFRATGAGPGLTTRIRP